MLNIPTSTDEAFDPLVARYLVFSAAAIYAALSLLCALAPSCLPSVSIAVDMLYGPPLLLVWGTDIWLLYGVLTLLVAVLFSAVVYCRTPEARVIAGFFGAMVWLGAGYFSAALSI